MLAEIKSKSQVTIPRELMKKLSLSEGDKLEAFEKDGMICLMPVAVYPKKYIEELKDELAEVRKNLQEGKQPVFEDVEGMISFLDGQE